MPEPVAPLRSASQVWGIGGLQSVGVLRFTLQPQAPSKHPKAQKARSVELLLSNGEVSDVHGTTHTETELQP